MTQRQRRRFVPHPDRLEPRVAAATAGTAVALVGDDPLPDPEPSPGTDPGTGAPVTPPPIPPSGPIGPGTS